MEIERDQGPQPIAGVLEQLGLAASDLVAASGEQLTHKMVARALKGRRLTNNVMGKVVRALNRASGGEYAQDALFTYSPRSDVFGDGIRCAAGTVIRLGTTTNSGGNSSYPTGGDPSVHVRGGVLSPGTRHD